MATITDTRVDDAPAADAPARGDAAGPLHRPRRLRRTAGIRGLVRETRLSADSLVYPLFVCEGSGVRREVPSMPGVFQLSVDAAVDEAAAARADGVRAVLLFGLPAHKDERGTAAADPAAPVQTAVRAIRGRLEDVAVVTDVCLCEYTSHGHCGILDGETILNDATVHRLVDVAASHAEAGAHVVAPSDMMDGRVGAIRAGLDARASRTCRSCPTRRSTARPSTARSGTPPTRHPRSATGGPTRWTPPTPTRRCARWPSTSRRGRTSSWSSRRCPTWT